MQAGDRITVAIEQNYDPLFVFPRWCLFSFFPFHFEVSMCLAFNTLYETQEGKANSEEFAGRPRRTDDVAGSLANEPPVANKDLHRTESSGCNFFEHPADAS